MRFLFYILFITVFSACSVKHETLLLTKIEEDSAQRLAHKLLTLSSNINPSEATQIAQESHSYPKKLAHKYALAYPPLFHNFLVNIGAKERGLCYQWAEDLARHLRSLNSKTLRFEFIVANLDQSNEHTAISVFPTSGNPLDGIVLDPWRNSSKLYWIPIKDDPKYHWQKR